MLVTLWNLAMALGGTVGGILLELGGASALPATTALLSIPALLVVVAARRHGFVPALAVDSERATRWRSSEPADQQDPATARTAGWSPGP
jgi:choline-glycine betaine transporter